MLLPTVCPVCERPGPAPCAVCINGMRRSAPVPIPAGLIACRALLAYDGPARDLVARLKYRNARSALPWLSAGMASLVRPQDQLVVVTWAPTTSVRRRARGFDQAELLARHLAARLALPCPSLLVRLPGPPQTGRSHAEREAGPQFQPRRAAQRLPPPGIVLLVDDVVTTGATLAAAAAALSRAGAGGLIGLAVAHTPARARAEPAA